MCERLFDLFQPRRASQTHLIKQVTDATATRLKRTVEYESYKVITPYVADQMQDMSAA